MDPRDSIATKYEPGRIETRWYATWQELGFFDSKPDPARKPYTIVIPPPNVTGVLHMGHMLNNTIQDVLIRRKRMQGYNACWVPGTDHASIATEAKVVAMLRERGIKKSDLTRDEFLQYAWEWKEKYGGIILEQLKKLGASCDWKRTAFTMDPDLYQSVIDIFVDLYRKGNIYRGLRMVNWDPVGQTALSDEEVIHKETESKLYHVRYVADDGSADAMVIATTRPETIMADVAIAVHPDDERYQAWHGRLFRVPFTDRAVPVIADAYVDPAFGTGCLKVTPAHDINDYEIGQRHNLPVLDILNANGTLSDVAPPQYRGLDRFEARKRVAADLEAAGLLVKTETLRNSVGHSERTNAVIEPRLSLQWYLKMKDLCQPALKAVLEPGPDGGVQLIPSKFINTYRHWMENVRDWCISRQLWWGHRIPAWYTPDGKPYVAHTAEDAYAQAKADGFTGAFEDLKQDEDVLDTWFSSWLWPISVFDASVFRPANNPPLDAKGFYAAKPEYPAGNADLNYYYETDDLITAPEILFFWVARMMIAGYEYRGRRPFKNVYLTGIVRDKLGRKMSKSLGNSPDPLDLIEKYSADGVRVGMLLCSPAGNDLPFDESLCEQGRNFANKLWNASRLVQVFGTQLDDAPPRPLERLALDWFESRINVEALEMTQQFEQFRISEALMTVYKLVWDDFCSWFLELMKPAPGHTMSRAAYEQTLRLFERLLQLLHPFMPFITEELWHTVRDRSTRDCVIVSALPQFMVTDEDTKDVAEMDLMREVVTALRAFRSEKNLSPKEALPLVLKTPKPALFTRFLPLLTRAANLSEVAFTDEPVEGAFSLVVRTHELYIRLAEGAIDVEAERKRIQSEIDYTQGFLESVNKKLSNERFVANAKPDVVANEQKKQADAQARLTALREQLAAL